MIEEIVFLGQPIELRPGIVIYPPTVQSVIRDKEYNVYLRLLTYSQEEIEDEFLENNKTLEVYPTPIEFLLGNCYNNLEYRGICERAFKFFLREDVTFLYDQKKILVGKLENVLSSVSKIEDLVMIDEELFFEFQNVIRGCAGKKTVEPPNPNEHPRLKEMKRKARYRDRVKAKQAAKGKDGISLLALMASICCMGIGITPLNIGEMSYASLQLILQKYQEKEKYELDIKSLLAGASSKKVKPKYWIRNFEE